jgi:hypothetical protein
LHAIAYSLLVAGGLAAELPADVLGEVAELDSFAEVDECGVVQLDLAAAVAGSIG